MEGTMATETTAQRTGRVRPLDNEDRWWLPRSTSTIGRGRCAGLPHVGEFHDPTATGGGNGVLGFSQRN